MHHPAPTDAPPVNPKLVRLMWKALGLMALASLAKCTCLLF